MLRSGACPSWTQAELADKLRVSDVVLKKWVLEIAVWNDKTMNAFVGRHLYPPSLLILQGITLPPFKYYKGIPSPPSNMTRDYPSPPF